jgi:hypothetical protein
MTAYLLCFTDDDGQHALFSDHAGHYMGKPDKDVDERREEHQTGCRAKLTRAAAAAGITFIVARTWPGRFPEERRLKGRPSGSRELKEKCPNCQPMPRIDRWAGGKPAWARQAEPEAESPQHRDQRHPSPITQAAAPAAQSRPQADPYQRGVHMATHFIQRQFDAARTADQVEATHRYVTQPFRENLHTPAQAETYRGYEETVTNHLARLRAASRSDTRAQAEKADMEMEAG